jgi:hypothetical protein
MISVTVQPELKGKYPHKAALGIHTLGRLCQPFMRAATSVRFLCSVSGLDIYYYGLNTSGAANTEMQPSNKHYSFRPGGRHIPVILRPVLHI